MMTGNITPCDGIHRTVIMGAGWKALPHMTVQFPFFRKTDLLMTGKKMKNDRTHALTNGLTEHKCVGDGIHGTLIMGVAWNRFFHKAFIFRKNEKPTFARRGLA